MLKYELEKMSNASPEAVAYQLMMIIADIEKKQFSGDQPDAANRIWILDTYAQCIQAVHGKRYLDPYNHPATGRPQPTTPSSRIKS